MHLVPYMLRIAKILILNSEGIIQKNSYVRIVYESVDDRRRSVDDLNKVESRKMKKKS